MMNKIDNNVDNKKKRERSLAIETMVPEQITFSRQKLPQNAAVSESRLAGPDG
jgi:hypothetical protein